MISLTKDNKLLGYELLCSFPGVFHFVTTRWGGCGEGNYASFNCSPYSDDEPERVKSNQEVLRSMFPKGSGELVVPYQTHQTEVRIIDSVYNEASEDERARMLRGVDALVTGYPGYCLCISTADCIPVLLFDERNKIVGAIHAGWRGTVNYIVSRTVEIMKECFGTRGEDVIACIGPGISLENFEVGDEVYNAFHEAGFEVSHISVKNPLTGKWHIDLWEANRLQLMKAGVLPANIEVSGICTYKNHERFFSARRLGIKSGRILSGIMLLP